MYFLQITAICNTCERQFMFEFHLYDFPSKKEASTLSKTHKHHQRWRNNPELNLFCKLYAISEKASSKQKFCKPECITILSFLISRHCQFWFENTIMWNLSLTKNESTTFHVLKLSLSQWYEKGCPFQKFMMFVG